MKEPSNEPKQPSAPAKPAVAPVSRYILAFLQRGGDTINRAGVRAIQDELDLRITTPPESTEIDVWLHSPGGDAHAAYKLMLDLRHRCRKLNAVVPDFAKSAATLLIFGMDKIYMGPAAELGPLDVQMEHPHREGEIVSGLDVANSLEFLGSTAIGLIVRGGASVFSYTGLPRTAVLDDLSRFAAQFLKPAVARLDIHMIHRAANMLRVAEGYAKLLLKMRNPDPGSSIQQVDEQKLMDKLINEYPAHEFIIGREEAHDLGLPVAEGEDYDLWSEAVFLWRNLMRSRTEHSLVRVLTEADVAMISSEHAKEGENEKSAQRPDPDAVRPADRSHVIEALDRRR